MISIDDKKEQICDKARQIMRFHYCENNTQGLLDALSDRATWLGAGNSDYVVGKDKITEFFRPFIGSMPHCTLENEQYEAAEISGDVFVCNGRFLICIELNGSRLVQSEHKVSFVFHWAPENIVCHHIHCSNSSEEMLKGEPESGGKSYQHVRDMLEHLQNEMHRKNEQISVILKAIPGGLKCSRDDETYSYVFVSEEAAGLFGYTVDEFMQASGGSAVGAVYPEDLPRVMRGLAADFAVGAEYAQKYRVRCKDGSLKWILDRGRRCMDAQGNAVFNSLYLDVTQSEEDEQKYLEQSELLNSIYNTVPCGIIRLKGAENEYWPLTVNPAAWRLTTGQDENRSTEVWKSGMAETVLPDDQKLMIDSYEHLMIPGDRHEVDYRVKWYDGSTHILHGINYLISKDHETRVIQRIFIDITESKALQDAYEEARRGNAAKSEFLSQMSHDMRTPMNAIIGLTTLAKETNDLGKIKGYLDNLQLSSELLLSLINDVLDTEMIERNVVTVSPSPYAVSELIDIMEVFLRPLCKKRQISHTIQYCGEQIEAALVDKTRLNQIIMNLLSNAVKFTPDGGEISLIINILRETTTHVTVQFVIEDTGIGMDQDYLQHLYEPFSRESRKGYERIEGNGLGLAVTKGLVEALGGRITVQSRLNQGTRFLVELTMEKCEPADQGKTIASEENLHGLHVLLCEDNEINAEIASHLLQVKGIKVDWAKDGYEGLACFEKSPIYDYDAVLMDIRMPVMDGITAAKRIRFLGRPDASTIPIIAMTANAFDQDREETRKAGMNAHLAKPVSPELLYHTLLEWCAASGSREKKQNYVQEGTV